MKKIRKDIFNYFIIIFLSVFIGTLALFIAYLLPQEKISNHVLESISVFEKENLYYEVIDGFETTKLDNFTDALILDELNYNGKEKALKKAMSAYGYTNNSDPIDVLVKAKQDKRNDLIKTTYERYWHGNNVIYKILFYFFNYQEIRMLNTLLLCLLLIFLIKVICLSRIKRFLPCFVLSLLIINPFIMGLSLQYFVCYIIMLISFISGCDINKVDIKEFYNYKDYLVNFGLSNQLVSILARIYSNDDNVNPYLLLDELNKYDSKKYVLKK